MTRVSLSLALVLALPLTAQAPLTDVERLHGLSMIWREAAYNFAFFDHVKDLDWDQAYKDHIPKVLEAKDTLAYYQVLQRFMALLKDGHTGVTLPPELASLADAPPLRLREVEGRALVIDVAKDWLARIPLGSEVLEVDGLPMVRHLKERVEPTICASSPHVLRHDTYANALMGQRGTEVVLKVRTPEGQVSEHRCLRNRAHAKLEMVNPPPSAKAWEYRDLGEGLVYFAIHTFGDREAAKAFEARLDAFKAAKGIIFDLRRNGGGNTGNGYPILGAFLQGEVKGAAWKTREHVAAFKAWGTGGGTYAKYGSMGAWREGGQMSFRAPEGPKLTPPVVLLTGPNTASAAEDFLIFFEAYPRATRVGQPSNGSTGQPLHFPLPGGGMARICAKRDTFPNGKDFVGTGIQPQVRVDVTLEEYLGRKDITLEKGVEVLRKTAR